MHRIEIVGRGFDDFDIRIYDERNIYLAKYSIDHISALHAFIFIRGLIQTFGAGIDRQSSNAWEHIMLMYRTESSKN